LLTLLSLGLLTGSCLCACLVTVTVAGLQLVLGLKCCASLVLHY
jgi:hypothetical protein